MPELAEESSSPPQPAALIPSIPPDEWESFAVFRESFLMYLTPQAVNSALRLAAETFFTLLLEHSGEENWPDWPESPTRTELRAAAADLRHSQGFLASIGQERHASSLSPEDKKLAKYASDLARSVHRLANALENKLAREAAV
jgi:hypothetical protein